MTTPSCASSGRQHASPVGIAAGPFLIVVMLISRDGRLMGRYRNGRLAATLGWATTAIMLVAGAVGLWLTVTGS